MKFLIAGYGSIGRRHMRNLLALGEKDIILYRTGHSTLPEDELGGMIVETDLQAALARRPDAVIIANPTANHLDVAIPAARAGCHILMEKPVSHSMARLDELKAALDQAQREMLVGFQFRFHPGLRKMAELIRTKAVGRPLSFRAEWGEYLPGWHPWEDYRQSYSARSDLGGGVVLTLSHPLDYLRWLLGEVESVWAFTGRISDLDLQVEDIGEIGMRFTAGVVGSLHLDYYRRPPTHRLEVVCSDGVLQWDNADGAVRMLSAVSGEETSYDIPHHFERNQMFLAELKHFIEVVRGNEKPLCTFEDGLRSMQIVTAIYESSNQCQKINL